MNDGAAGQSGSLRARLGDEHVHLELLFEETLEAAHAGVDTRTLGEIWTRFVSALRGHLNAEEEELFPFFESTHDAEINQLRDAHRAIRSSLDELDVEVDLHLLRPPRVDAFVELLRSHAREEDGGLYAWAEDNLDEPRRRRLWDRLSAARGLHS